MKAMLVLIAGMLTACQSWQARTPDHRPAPPHRGVGAGAGTSGAMGSGTASGAGQGTHGLGKGNWYGMCEMQRQIADAPTPDERQALVEKLMPGMSQEAREQHLQMMQERCR
jgi:hypothetical protein